MPGEAPVAFAERMAREKAEYVHSRFADRVVLAADTVVFIGQEILGKPENADDAVRMLSLLSGRTHHVVTAVCLLGPAFQDFRAVTTEVEFAPIDEIRIREYVNTGEPMDKAGGYAIQGGAAGWVIRIDGDYNNVVGLPLDMAIAMLRDRRP
jgi:septum formation protein